MGILMCVSPKSGLWHWGWFTGLQLQFLDPILDRRTHSNTPQLRPAGLLRGTSQYSTLAIIMTKAVVLFAIFVTVAQGLVDIEWKFYPKPQKKCAEVGEEVTFNWGGSGHNVVEVNSKKDFDDCTGFVESDEGEN